MFNRLLPTLVGSAAITLLMWGCSSVEITSKDDPLDTTTDPNRAIGEIGLKVVNDPVSKDWLFGSVTQHPAYSIFLEKLDSGGYRTGHGVPISICGPTTPLLEVSRCVGKGLQYKLFHAPIGAYALTQVNVSFPRNRFIGSIANPVAVTLKGGGIEYIGDINIRFVDGGILAVSLSSDVDAAKREAMSYKYASGKAMYIATPGSAH